MFGGRSAAYPQANTPTTRQVFGKEVFVIKTEVHKCIVCGKPFMFEAEYCCDGNMCGCMGLPIYPPICSDKCYEKAGWTLAKNTEQQLQPNKEKQNEKL